MSHRYGWIIGYVVRQWPSLLFIFGVTVSYSGVAALQPWPMKILVDYALGSAEVPAWLHSLFTSLTLDPTPAVLILTAALASLALFAVNSLLDSTLSLAWSATGQRMVYNLAADLFAHLQRLSLLFHSRRPVGDLLSRLTSDTYCVYTFAEGILIAPFRHLLTLAILGVVAWQLNPELTLYALALAPLTAGFGLLLGSRLKERARKSSELRSRLLSFVHQTLTAIPIVQAFGTEAHNGRQFRSLVEHVVAASQRGVLISSAYGLANGLMRSLGTAIILLAGGYQVLGGELSVGSLLVFLAYARSMQSSAMSLLSIYAEYKTVEASIERVSELLEVQEMVKDAPDAQPLPVRTNGKTRYLRLEEVTFGYEPGNPVLKGISLEVRPGEVIALIGPTGAGKSTLASLIPRLFDPWDGRVLLDGMDIRRIQLASLRAQIALVPQDPFLLPLSVGENIRYSRPNATWDEIVEAAVAAQADEFIRRLPDGYNTMVGERGATLSGGQKQRLSIARALLKNAPLLILDEPTSALDAETETYLMAALDNLMAGRTTIMIAHRLSTVRRADQVVILNAGKILESGPAGALLASPNLYRHFQAQQVATLAGEVAP
jgi:ATP-binding cassette, subfamily B, bacterial